MSTVEVSMTSHLSGLGIGVPLVSGVLVTVYQTLKGRLLATAILATAVLPGNAAWSACTTVHPNRTTPRGFGGSLVTEEQWFSTSPHKHGPQTTWTGSNCSSQRGLWRGSLVSPRSLSEIQNLRPHLRLIEPDFAC